MKPLFAALLILGIAIAVLPLPPVGRVVAGVLVTAIAVVGLALCVRDSSSSSLGG